MIVYPDSSFLVSYYVSDSGSVEADRRMAVLPRVMVTPFHRAELANALFQWVFRGKFVEADALAAYGDFEQDCESGLWEFINLPEATFSRSVNLAKRRVGALGVRTLDTLHVAAAIELKADRFWTFDDRQKQLAEAEGLATS